MSRYEEFFSIGIEHAYCPGSADQIVTIRPDPDTDSFLEKNGFLIKWKPNGLKVLAPFKPQTNDLNRPLTEDNLFFHLFPDREKFSLVTEFSSIGQNELFYFTNMGAANGQLPFSGISRIDPDLPVNPDQRKNGYRAVGLVELHPDLIGTDPSIRPVSYKISFQTVSHLWKYYFIIDDDETALFTIEDHQQEVTFTGTDLADDPLDAIGLALREVYGDRKLGRFVSDAAIAAYRMGRKGLQLKKGDQILIGHLANPEFIYQGSKIKVMDLRTSQANAPW